MSIKVNFTAYPDRPAQAECLGQLVAEQLIHALKDKETVSLALPGGTTPIAFFHVLSKQSLDWSRVIIMPGDERWVDETSEHSNAKLIQQHMLINHAAKASFLPFYSQAVASTETLDDLLPKLARYLPLDVCVLGMGDDAHTASLFPNAQGLMQAMAKDAPNALIIMLPTGEKRITLSAQMLKQAKNVHLLIHGQRKLDTLNMLGRRTVMEAPILCVLKEEHHAIHYAG